MSSPDPHALVESFAIPEERQRAMAAMVPYPGGGARANRGLPLAPDRAEALRRGLRHDNPAVRRCCLELLDNHPDPQATPLVALLLDDPVARVRWHAVHALLCDACSPGQSLLTPAARAALERVAREDPSEKVRSAAATGLAESTHA